jgi:nucleoid-associated protein YgaU
MTPKDCYEAGLLDGVYQAREAIKAAARAALGGDND